MLRWIIKYVAETTLVRNNFIESNLGNDLKNAAWVLKYFDLCVIPLSFAKCDKSYAVEFVCELAEWLYATLPNE